MTTIASGQGIATIHQGTTLDVWFPNPALSALSGSAPAELIALATSDNARGVTREVISLEIDISKAPSSAADAYLRLHLLSHRLVKPHGVALDGIFGLLSNVVWTSVGPRAVEGFEITRARLKASYGHISVYGVDKFPRMVD